MTGNDDAVFVDTNVIVYATVKDSPFHQRARSKLAAVRKAGVSLWISRQVIREYLAVVTRPQSFSNPMTGPQAAESARQLFRHFQVAEETALVTKRLLALLESTPVAGKQIHDANIVATMQASGITRLLTHNTADFNRYGELIRLEPLLEPRQR